MGVSDAKDMDFKRIYKLTRIIREIINETLKALIDKELIYSNVFI